MKEEKTYSQAYSDLKGSIRDFKLAIGRLFELEKIINWMKKKI
ncbi:hypothetical protein [Enterococcus ureasiticus]|nr:hypothetical protein [Enterococcus ureasiticus]